jgi:hypothetical protein
MSLSFLVAIDKYVAIAMYSLLPRWCDEDDARLAAGRQIGFSSITARRMLRKMVLK